MNKKFLSLLALAILTILLFSRPIGAESQFGGVLVYPNVVELDFTNTYRKFVSRSIKVENPTNKPFRVRAYVEGWNLDQYGGIVFLDEPDNNSLNKYVKFNPKEFDLAPGQNQLVRLTAKLPEDAEGEFRSIIFFETVNPKKEILAKNNDKVNVNVQFKTRYGVAVYAYKGDVDKKAELKDFKYEKTEGNSYLVATLKNDGNIHCNVEGDITLIPASAEDEKDIDEENILTSPLARYTILPDSTQKYRILVPNNIKSGDYRAVLKLNYKDADERIQVLGGETQISYKAKKPVYQNNFKNVNDEIPEKTPENISKPVDLEDLENLDLDSEINLEE